ncbi:MAG: C45 family peptidase [Caldilinea sp.]|nr:C45 family peptidase [Caldilinea sp.]MDW8440411.1 C45 family peptidase [Caldilineaceae bacterium]
MTLLTLTLVGTAAEMGRQHGRQIAHLRTHLVQVIAQRLNELHHLGADEPAAVQACLDFLKEGDRPLLAYLAGLSEALGIETRLLHLYTLSSYLRDRWKARQTAPASVSSLEDGCTVWAASGPATVDGRPLLVKNRDYHADHLPLQMIACVVPTDGYRYMSVGSAGSPEVFSSGINERGLAVADTHVLSRDIGPGLPRFSLMRELLTHHDSVASALDYLRSVIHMGAGTLMLADASGALALCESGHRRCGYALSDGETALVNANHFETSALAKQWIDDEPPPLRGNSWGRHRRISAAVQQCWGAVDLAWAQRMMAAHGSPQEAICRHPLPGHEGDPTVLGGGTISSVIFLPAGDAESAAPTFWLTRGAPCQGPWVRWKAA